MKNAFKPGDIVVMINCIEAERYKDIAWEVASNPWDIPSGATLVKLKGFSGGFDVTKLKKVE